MNLVVRPHPADAHGVRVDVTGATSPITVDWGDASDQTVLKRPGKSPVQHTYPDTGGYTITLLSQGDSVARQHVVIRGTTGVTGVQVEPGDGTARVEFNTVDDGSGLLPYYRITWPSGDDTHAWAVPGTSVHADVDPGEHEVRIVDVTTGRVGVFPVTVRRGGDADPDFEVDESRDDPMSIVLRLVSVDDRPVHVWWDDAPGPQVVERPQSGMELPHTYNHPGHYLQTVAYAGDTILDRSKSTAMTIPTRDEETSGAAGNDGSSDLGRRDQVGRRDSATARTGQLGMDPYHRWLDDDPRAPVPQAASVGPADADEYAASTGDPHYPRGTADSG